MKLKLKCIVVAADVNLSKSNGDEVGFYRSKPGHGGTCSCSSSSRRRGKEKEKKKRKKGKEEFIKLPFYLWVGMEV